MVSSSVFTWQRPLPGKSTHFYPFSRSIETSELYHRTCRLGWFLPVIDLRDPGFLSLNSIAEYITSTTLRAVSHCISQSAITPCRTRPVVNRRKPGCNSRTEARFKILEFILQWRTWYNLNAAVPRPAVSYANPSTYHGRPLSLACPGPYFRMSYGRIHGICQVNAIGPSYLVFLLLAPTQTSPTLYHYPSYRYAVAMTVILVLEPSIRGQKHCPSCRQSL
jgi:hypothetical protein